MAKLTTAEFIEAIKELSVLELNELVKACEEEFGVSAAAGVVVAAAGAGEAAEEKTEFDVELTEVGPNKVKVIKVVREITGLGLKEAKEAVDSAPKTLKEAVSKEEAEDIKAKLEAEALKLQLNNCTFQFDMEGISSEVPFVVCVSSKAGPHLPV
ncbi:50S ribosomal protein L7/L12 [Coprococcus catus]|uniref:Large ribosomal subunit protein bL12 n=2 Tax=Lachnospiraceae TaxID=186803 RepID=A0A3E2TJ78_9FIRM|nr:50S ribosomal protein L7/L12 [Coprococcus catus]